MSEQIVIVNEQDEIVGLEAKARCHLGDGILHRAITIFIFNDQGEILLTRRSAPKMLWPNFWDTSCSTHVHQTETYEQAGERRLKEELGFSCKLEFISKFQYQVKYKDIGSENEICTLLMGHYDGNINPNPSEVSDCKWVSVQQLAGEINNVDITPWLKIAFEEYLAHITEPNKAGM
ncbi:isopentenyl-diphosphate delta-isomerase [candidate division Kazan bacterium RIFCSPHIGHO2_01_FULL_49_10]|uniref:Isopentenyl-diphosphate delta-isomerase n=1 Tax=candidate division Kazan bacterium RIFCSPLOWO2_01_FULL_48_13 TaxID=1798539 RepID=A0A1F4PP10_UNCK3|nr:MAG: isopentenyl-diphosphate delta-isomerase [candidate division Kazan bacterium RIFCSPHIGHO2_01_FULL_49_10]OGB85427.1 MAG: isopentenyl-diphosphate delta-isomerase [candidate division Kazan bacterium RIFCSPLOWO2_01_FULL_48_13]